MVPNRDTQRDNGITIARRRGTDSPVATKLYCCTVGRLVSRDIRTAHVGLTFS